ncbi:MAG TPA: aminopeptidase P N-terminal domain-containing protein, partial [Candidatus Saccharimonadaceae bacterium]|nr:aminopeptidase P N-terminal domain-containing protein [Candidatus Saccharimonadaceae bacterium]
GNFWYLSGIEYPDWRVVIDGTRGRTWLIAPDVDDVHQVFDGSLDHSTAKRICGADEVLDRTAGDRLLRDLALKHSVVYTLNDPPYAEYFDFALNPAPRKLREELSRIFTTTRDCQKELAELRAIKQPTEVLAIKKAVKLTTDTFQRIHDHLSDFHTEYEIEAEFSYIFRRNGARGHAYDPIVAGGHNACTLHYVANHDRLRKGQMVLIDIGARYGGYAADVTRTYALGEPSKRAQEIHSATRAAQAEIVKLLGPDVSVTEYQVGVDRIMKRTLYDLGLTKDPDDDVAYRHYMPHSVSHGLGVDVHDRLGAPHVFQAGMVLTVEPGIYVPEKSIGVRIEDDILITENGVQNLSSSLSTAW